jgi:hypothetical protein
MDEAIVTLVISFCLRSLCICKQVEEEEEEEEEEEKS